MMRGITSGGVPMRKLLLLSSLILALAMACSSPGTTPIVKDLSGDVRATPDTAVLGSDGTADLGVADLADPDKDVAGAPDQVATDGTEPLDTVNDGLSDGTTQPDVPEVPEVTVATYADASTVPAGVALQFDCKVQGLEAGTFVTYLQLSGPADVEVDDLAVTFAAIGKYNVACRAKWEGGEVVDPTPLKVEVLAGGAASVETELSKNAVKAGETVSVACIIKDGYGNFVETPSKVAVNPEYGLDVYGTKILAIKVGTYQVSCFEPISGLSDSTPETLSVSPGIPKKIETVIDADTLVAGEVTGVTCTATDAYGNKVANYPIVVFLSPGLFIQGSDVGGTKAGSYQVICVPQEDLWDLFQLDPKMLTILPGAASGVSVQPVPQKPVYKMFEVVKFIVTAVDDYGNLVEDVELLPLAVDPADPGIIQKGELKYKLEAEGFFTFSACLVDAPNVCGDTTLAVDGYGPVITIKFPERGASITGKPSVNVTGNVVDPVSGVASFTINGTNVPLDDNGDFLYAISATQGMNMLVALAEDPNGLKTWLVQAFYYSPVWHEVDINDPEGSKILDSILFFLGEEAFDKIPHDYSKPDNLSTILELALINLDIGSFIPNPVASAGPYKVYVGPFYYGPPAIHVFPIPEGILAEIHLYDIKVHIAAKGSCKVLFIDLCPDVSGDVEIDSIEMWEGLNIWVEDGQIKTKQYENYIGVYGVNVNIDGILGFLFGWLINWFVDGYVGELEKTAMEMVDEQVTAISAGFLDALAINQQMEIANPMDENAPPIELSLVSSLRELLFSPVGVEVRLDAAVLAPKGINKTTLGSIGRASCLEWVPETFYIDKEQFAVMAIHDDLLNEVLYSAWYAGLLDMELPLDDLMDPDALGDLGLGDIEDLGLKDMKARTEFFLPPIITSCNDPWDEILQLQVGDLYVELEMKLLNEPVTMGMFVSLAAEAIIEIVDAGDHQEISIAIGEVDPVVAQITYVSEGLEGSGNILSLLVQGLVVPMILESFADGALASFPLPVIDISNLSAQYLPPGIVWKFVIDSFFRELGYTSLIAHIEAL
jgi:hypothetical protein